MRNRGITIIAAIAICFLSFLCFSRTVAAAETVTIAVPVMQGLSVGSLSKMLKELAAIMSKKTGYIIQIKELPFKKGDDEEVFLKVMKEMQGGADFGYVSSPLIYVKNEKQAARVMTPAITLTLSNSKEAQICAYVRKNSSYKSITDLKGKTYGGLHTAHARFLMHNAGIDSPIKSFFGKAVFVDDTTLTQPFDDLLSSKIDVYISLAYVARMTRNSNKKYLDGIREFGCSEYEHSWTFFSRKGADKAIVDKITAEMLKSQKDKDYAQFKFMFAAVKGQFVTASLDDLKKTREIAALAAKFGWDKEEKAFIKSMPK